MDSIEPVAVIILSWPGPDAAGRLKSPTPDHPHVGARRNNLGLVLQDLGDLDGARSQLEEARRISEAALAPDHPTVHIIRDNLDDLPDP